MIRFAMSLAMLVALASALCACGSHDADEAPKAAAAAPPQKTVFDPQLQALQRAKDVQKTLDAEQKRNNQAIDDAEKGEDKDKDGGPR
jgi:hypothetical protein